MVCYTGLTAGLNMCKVPLLSGIDCLSGPRSCYWLEPNQLAGQQADQTPTTWNSNIREQGKLDTSWIQLVSAAPRHIQCKIMQTSWSIRNHYTSKCILLPTKTWYVSVELPAKTFPNGIKLNRNMTYYVISNYWMTSIMFNPVLNSEQLNPHLSKNKYNPSIN